MIPHKVGRDRSLEQPREAARITTMHVLASRRAEPGLLERARSVLKVFGMRPRLQRGSLRHRRLVEETGRHARTAVGMAELARDVAVKIELVVAVDASA
jgi:hypothetical protein